MALSFEKALIEIRAFSLFLLTCDIVLDKNKIIYIFVEIYKLL